MKYKICTITGSRADFGILEPLLMEIKNDKKLRLDLIITGSHVSRVFGSSIEEVKKKNFSTKNIIKIIKKKDDGLSILNQSAFLINQMSKKLKKLKPNCILILGDRFEIFISAYCAFLMNIPIVHLHGGEETIGSLDNALRHGISQMADLHFVSTNQYFKKILSLGKEKKTIFNYGSLAIENFSNINFLDKVKLEQNINFKFKKNNLLITLHPTTKENITFEDQINPTLKALKKFKEVGKIFTVPNNDIGSKFFIKKIRSFIKKDKNSKFIKSMGFENYSSCLKYVDCVVGNSSSGIIEAPYFNIFSLNIGNRQLGRIKGKSIIDVNYNSLEISKVIKSILIKKKKNIKFKNPYYKKNTKKNIKSKIKMFLKKIKIKKYDN